jgi:hypothetical protein
MNTHYQQALNHWEQIKMDIIAFGREAKKAILLEEKTIRDFSIALCGNASLEDRIGRYIMAAEFVDSLNSVQYGNVKDWLTPTHYTELRKIEQATDKETALDYMQDLITELPNGNVNVKPIEWLRGKRSGQEISTAEVFHRLWKSAARAMNDALSELERKGNLATKEDRRRVRILTLVIRLFQTEKAEV